VYPARVVVGPGMYQLGLIDLLQEWDWNKKGEQCLKRIFRGHCIDYDQLSAVEPIVYCKRFKEDVLGRIFDLGEGIELTKLEEEASHDLSQRQRTVSLSDVEGEDPHRFREGSISYNTTNNEPVVRLTEISHT